MVVLTVGLTTYRTGLALVALRPYTHQIENQSFKCMLEGITIYDCESIVTYCCCLHATDSAACSVLSYNIETV